MTSHVRPRVTFFQRRCRPGANFSLEFIFEDVRRRLADRIDATVAVASWRSEGILRRILILLQAALRCAQVNHVTGDISFVGLLLPGRRTIQTIPDCGQLARTTGLRHWLLKQLWVAAPVRRCRWVTVISDATRQELLKYVPGCDPAKIRLIPVAISEAFVPRPAEFRQARPRILQVGTAPNKNIVRLAAALRGLDCELEIIGRLPPDAEAALRESAVAYRARAELTAQQVREAYAASDVVVLASTYEGFGMPILEAQATGRPVVTSNLLSMPWVAGGAACLVDPLDVASIRAGLKKVMEDADYRAVLVARGFQNVTRFSPEEIALQYLALYLDVAGQDR